MRTMMIEYFDRSIVLEVHNERPPTDEEWEELMTLGRSCDARGALIVSDGGGPNARQRRALAKVVRGRDIQSAVVTPSMVTRGVVTALQWLGQSIQAFEPSQLEGAMQYARIAPERVADALAHIARMKCQIAGVSVESLGQPLPTVALLSIATLVRNARGTKASPITHP